MTFKRNTIPDPEHRTRTIEILKRIDSGEQTRETMTELFLLYNDRILPRETCKTCKGTRDRVYSKTKKFYNL